MSHGYYSAPWPLTRWHGFVTGLSVGIEPLTKCGACGFTQHVLEIKCIKCEMTTWRNRELAAMKTRNAARSLRQISERAAKRNG